MSKNGISNIWGAFWGVCGGFRTKLNTFRSAHMNLGQMLSLVRQLFGDMQNPQCGGLLRKSQYFWGPFWGVRGGFRTKLKTFCSAHGHFGQLFSLVRQLFVFVRQILIPGGYDPLNHDKKKTISPIVFT